MAALRIGLAGWSYKDWAGIVYPSSRPRGFHEPAYLSQFFDTLEINTSFYGPPRPDACRQWLDYVAGNARFLFTAKLWRKFTHERAPSAEDERAVRAGFDVLRDARKLGAVLVQFPFSFHRTPENVTHLQSLLGRFEDYPLVVEMRHSSWNHEDFHTLLRERHVGFCNIDQPIIGRSLEPSEHATAQVGYIRLHGRRYDTWFSDDPKVPSFERYNYLYSEKELEPWAERVRAIAKDAASTFVITNNHYLGKGAVNALQLIHLLEGRRVQAPASLVQYFPELTKIADAVGDEKHPSLF
jgi:uncharacterized protein YecE (DUF72 family)